MAAARNQLRGTTPFLIGPFVLHPLAPREMTTVIIAPTAFF